VGDQVVTIYSYNMGDDGDRKVTHTAQDKKDVSYKHHLIILADG